MSRTTEFAECLRKGEKLVGTFQKIPHHQVTEILSLTGMDFVVFDTEHSSFGSLQLDTCILAARGADMPNLVRVSRNQPDAILSALDLGATGVFVPHVSTRAEAECASAAAHYLSGTRGFSPSTRAGGYGTRGLDPYMKEADRDVAVVLQIEDAAALDNLTSIATTPGIAGLFVGRADLATSMRLDWNDVRLDQATEAVAKACVEAGVACGAYLADERRQSDFQGWGVHFFVVGSDQGAMRAELSRVPGSFTFNATMDKQSS